MTRKLSTWEGAWLQTSDYSPQGSFIECLEKIEQALEAEIGSQECADMSEFTPEEFCLFKHDVFTDRSGPMRALESPGSLSHYLQGFIHPRWCRISSINSINHQISTQNRTPAADFGRKSKDLAQGIFLRSGALPLGPTKIWLLNGVQWYSQVFHVFFIQWYSQVVHVVFIVF